MSERKWSELQLDHISWSATPKALRELKTKTEWAERLGVTSRTLYNWEHLPGFWDEVRELANRHVMEELPDVLAALLETAKRSHTAPSVSAQRIVLEYLGSLVPEGSTTVNLTFTAEDIAAAKRELEEWERQQEVWNGS
ncbi:MAG: phBC6A51 family helix-turn-helix protein [Chloroflexota bacterium]|nr:phBC6A51 family helix-turn-helix protein [Chloroflexota bacterium]